MKREISNIRSEGEYLFLCFDVYVEREDGSNSFTSHEIHPCRPTKIEWLDVDGSFFVDEDVKELVEAHKSNWTREIKEKYKDFKEQEMINQLNDKTILTQEQMESILSGL